MTSSFVPTWYAIDFGTSNSLLAAANAERIHAPIPLDASADDPTILRSVLFFPNAERCAFGLDAIRQYVEAGMHGRLIRSVKKHLPSRTFVGTSIDERPMSLEELIGVMLREMRTRANRFFGADVRRVVLGRPARFSDDPDDDAFAQERLERAARIAGFGEVRFLAEPVAAAREYRRLAKTGSLALVADFGGGTSDFTILRLEPGELQSADVLAIGGVGVAGDAFDAGLMRSKVAHHFGADVIYRVPFGSNHMKMPPALMERLCSPADLSILRRQDVINFLRNIRAWSLGPEDAEKIDQLFTLIEDGLGFSVFEAIERTKRALTTADAAELVFEYPTISIHERVTRGEFDRASERVLARIVDRLDETLASAGLSASDVEIVCCTGGTAKVPIVARAIGAKFPRARVEEFKSFHSIVEGLALHARELAAA
jgi:hypothetical chaperone protein